MVRCRSGGHWARRHAARSKERFILGISTKVLTERLRKLLDYELVTRSEFPGKVQRVEYQLTETGRKLAGLLEQLRDLDEEHARRDSGRSDSI